MRDLLIVRGRGGYPPSSCGGRPFQYPRGAPARVPAYPATAKPRHTFCSAPERHDVHGRVGRVLQDAPKDLQHLHGDAHLPHHHPPVLHEVLHVVGCQHPRVVHIDRAEDLRTARGRRPGAMCPQRRVQPFWGLHAEGAPPPPPCDIPSGCCSFTGPWTVTRSSLRMLRRVAAFCRPLRPVLLLVSFPRSRSPVVGVLGLPPPPPFVDPNPGGRRVRPSAYGVPAGGGGVGGYPNIHTSK